MSWRFYPLEGFPRLGILRPSGHSKPVVAEFLTPQAAKALQQRKGKAA
jgi:hypothetical protein